MRQGNVVHRIHRVAGPDTPADGNQERRLVSRPDDDVLDPGRTMEVVPLLEPPLLALDDQQALAREDEEALLVILAVVHRHRLPRPDDAEIEAELVEVHATLEVAVHTELAAVEPLHVTDVPDEPAHSGSQPSTAPTDTRGRSPACRPAGPCGGAGGVH